MQIIEGATLISLRSQKVVTGEDIAIEGNTIVEVGKDLLKKYPNSTRKYFSGIITPGLVCSHTHLYSALAVGMTVNIAPSKDFCQILKHLWWRLDRAIDEEILDASAQAGVMNALESGVTYLVDHSASPEFINGSLDVIHNAYNQFGMKGILCYETSDRNGIEGANEGIAENVRFAKKIIQERAKSGNANVEAAIGAHAPFTLSYDTLNKLAEACESTNRSLHIHCAEDKYDAVDSRYRFGSDIAQRLDDAKLLNSKTLIGHGVHLTPSEIEIINKRDSFVIHNARSNMNNSVGYTSLLPTIKNSLLGTDGIGADMLEEFKFAYFKHREMAGPFWPGDFLNILSRGYELADRFTGLKHGNIERGYASDLVFWDYESPTPIVNENIGGHLAFGMSTRNIHSVMIGGKMVLENRIPEYDRTKIGIFARHQTQRLMQRMEERK